MSGRTERAPYPAEREVDVVLRSGRTAHVRPVRSEDAEAIQAFLERLSPESRWFRFFFAGANLMAAARLVAEVDYVDRYGIVAVSGGEVVAHGCYVREGRDRAELAFAVADHLQGQGLATILLAHLVEAAEVAGIETLTAAVLPANHRMLEVFRESGFPIEVSAAPGELLVEMPASLSAASRERFADRQRRAAAAGVAHVLEPASLAVVGASERSGSVGGAVLRNVLAARFAGGLCVVHPRASLVAGVPAYRSLRDVPEAPELAVVVVPATSVVDVARDAAATGVAALVVLSAGFAESGEAGRARQEDLLGVCREAGMRLVGPNCLGVLNTAVRLDATFAPVRPSAGRVGFMSQSGALGVAIIDAAQRHGLGLSSFVSAGNKADISTNDLLEYWEQNSETSVVLLYVESFGNPRRFGPIARRVARHKPIVAVKAGRSRAGARAAASHTGALIARSDAAVDALFAHAGVVRTDTLAELFELGALLAHQPLPAGRRVGIVTNGGGLGILCADACEAARLDVIGLSASVRARLRAAAPENAAVGNPVDLTASVQPDAYGQAVAAVAGSGEVDALIALFVAALGAQPVDFAHALSAAAETAPGLPVAAVFMSPDGALEALAATGRRIPAYAFPEEAARAMARAADYGVWRARRRPSAPAPPGMDRDGGAALLGRALERGEAWLTSGEAFELARHYGIPVLQPTFASNAAAAADAADRVPGPVALKAVAPGLVHKSDVGGVRLGLAGAHDVRRAASEMAMRLRDAGHPEVSFLVQPMAPDGVEMIVGVVGDPDFGPLVACGAGGVRAELLGDVVVRLAALDDGEAAEMVSSLRSFPLLTGYRGTPACDHHALANVVERVAALALAHAEVVELDLNPVVVSANGAVAVDARVRVHAGTPPRPGPSLQGNWP